MLWPSLVNDTERLFCWLFLAYQIDKIILSVLCCSLNENRMWSCCILKTLEVKLLPCANVMNFTQLTPGGSPTKRWATKTFLFISWKEFWNMSEDLRPKHGIVCGLCLLWLLHWWRAHSFNNRTRLLTLPECSDGSWDTYEAQSKQVLSYSKYILNFSLKFKHLCWYPKQVFQNKQSPAA